MAAYALRLYRIMVPKQVAEEIMFRDPQAPQRLYPQQALFEQLRGNMLEPPDPEPPPLGQFGPGEAAAIALARALGAVLLLNDFRPGQFARGLGLSVVSVPEMIVIIRAEQLISDEAARGMLGRCQATTSPQLIEIAARLLDALGDVETG